MAGDELDRNQHVGGSSCRAFGLLFAGEFLVISSLSLFYEGITTVVS